MFLLLQVFQQNRMLQTRTASLSLSPDPSLMVNTLSVWNKLPSTVLLHSVEHNFTSAAVKSKLPEVAVETQGPSSPFLEFTMVG